MCANTNLCICFHCCWGFTVDLHSRTHWFNFKHVEFKAFEGHFIGSGIVCWMNERSTELSDEIFPENRNLRLSDLELLTDAGEGH